MIEKFFSAITKGSLKYKWVTIGLSVLLMAAGVFAFTQLNQELIPAIEFPQTIVVAFSPEIDADVLLEEYTIPFENAMNEIEGVVNVETTTSNGFSLAIVRNEFGLDQEKMSDEIQTVLDNMDYPEGMETPELINFSLSDLPIISISISSEGLTLEELKELVEQDLIPELEDVDQVAAVDISGGQELPTEEEPTPEPTAEPIVEPTEEPEEVVEGVSLPQAWLDAFAAQGLPFTVVEQLNAQMVSGIASFAPDLLQDLTSEMLLAMSNEALAALPQDFFATLDAETLALLTEKMQVTEEVLEPVALPQAWIDAAGAQGLTIATTDDLTAELVGGITAFAPTMLISLTPEMLYVMPADALAALPQVYLLTLPADVQEKLLERLAAIGAGEETTPDQLPASWVTGGQAMNVALETVDDVTPEVIQTINNFAPQLLNALTADNLRLFSPEVLGWLPAEYIDSLDADLRAELEEIAGSVGGLGALAVAAAEEAANAAPGNPEDLPIQWTEAGKNSDLELNTVYDLDVGVFSGFIQFAPDMLDLLTPDNFRLMDVGLLALLPDEFLDTLDEELAVELREMVETAGVFVPTASITRVNGNHSLSVSIYKDKEANTVEVSHAAFEKLAELGEEYSELEFEVVFEQASFIEESIEGVTREGGLGAVFAVVVILVFLSGRVQGKYKLSWRSTVVTAVSIPLSVLMGFAMFRWLPAVVAPLLMPLVEVTRSTPVLGSLVLGLANLFPLGLTLNIMTLSGMTVAVGRVVDDSIVVLENIYRHIQRGDDQLTSVVKGTRDVSIAIFASTATTVVVFLPIGLLGGVIGSFFLPFGIAVTYALIASFLVAITIVPLLAFMFIRKEHLPPEVETGLQKAYSPVLGWALKNKGMTLAIAGVFLVGSLALFGTRPKAFVPNFGEITITTSVDLPEEYAMADTDELVVEFETAVLEIEGLRSVQVEIGGGGGFEAFFGGGIIDQTAAIVSMPIIDPEAANDLTAEVREIAVEIFGMENVIVSAGSMSSQGFGGFAMVASTQDFADLESFNQEAIDTLNEVEGLANVTSNLADVNTFLRVDGEPAIRFVGELETKDALGVTASAKEDLIEIAPESITISEGFETQQQTEGFAQTLKAIGTSIIIVYLVMVLTFGSWVHPFTILFSLPMAVIGASVALWVTDSILGMSSMIGLMMLVGIVVTNAIVLVDRVQANIKVRGMNVEEALMEGGRTRLRPILMTAIAAILALVPLAIGLSEGAIIAAELAIVVIGGLTTSTLLTLLIVPVMFSLLDRFSSYNRPEKKTK